MHIVIIGCGYIGYRVASSIQSLGFYITTTTTTEKKLSDLRKVSNKTFLFDSNNGNLLASTLKEADIILVSVASKTRKQYENTYLQTALIIQEALKERNNCKQLIYN